MNIRLAIAAITLFTAPALAAPLEGSKTIKLVEASGQEYPVATVAFAADENRVQYQISWNDDVFADHFLSMRPFKCLESPDKHWCRVPYPYEIARSITTDDLTDLEYDLLFVWKGSSEYGVNLWNGVYYKISIDGDRLVGRIYEMDMDRLGVPPDDGDLRPVQEKHLEEGDPDSHWLPRVVIE